MATATLNASYGKIPPIFTPLHGGSGPPSNTMCPGFSGVAPQNRTSIRSAVFVQQSREKLIHHVIIGRNVPHDARCVFDAV